jgi:hypothetical protein
VAHREISQYSCGSVRLCSLCDFAPYRFCKSTLCHGYELSGLKVIALKRKKVSYLSTGYRENCSVAEVIECFKATKRKARTIFKLAQIFIGQN